jgi:hypothetical protein
MSRYASLQKCKIAVHRAKRRWSPRHRAPARLRLEALDASDWLVVPADGAASRYRVRSLYACCQRVTVEGFGPPLAGASRCSGAWSLVAMTVTGHGLTGSLSVKRPRPPFIEPLGPGGMAREAAVGHRLCSGAVPMRLAARQLKKFQPSEVRGACLFWSTSGRSASRG